MGDEVSAGVQPTVESNTADSQSTTSQVTTNVDTTEKSQKPAAEVTTNESKAAADDSTVASKGDTGYVPYDRFSEVVREKNEYKQKALLFEKMQEDPELAGVMLQNAHVEQKDPVIAQAEETLKQMGYVKSSDVATLVEQKLAERDFTAKFISQVQELSKKYDGADGLPKFEPEAVAAYMDEKGFRDPEEAYIMMNKDAYIDAQVKARRGSTFSEKPGQPMSSVNTDTRAAEIAQAKKTGDWITFLKKFAPEN